MYWPARVLRQSLSCKLDSYCVTRIPSSKFRLEARPSEAPGLTAGPSRVAALMDARSEARPKTEERQCGGEGASRRLRDNTSSSIPLCACDRAEILTISAGQGHRPAAIYNKRSSTNKYRLNSYYTTSLALSKLLCVTYHKQHAKNSTKDEH